MDRRGSRIRGTRAWVLVLLMTTLCLSGSGPARSGDDPGVGSAICGGEPGLYGIRDFPCDKIQALVKENVRVGHRVRPHAWYLFAGVNQTTSSGELLWHTWDTATQVIPGQFHSEERVDVDRLRLGPLPGGRLERPTPDTPRFVGDEALPGQEIGGKNLALPGAPLYEVPGPVLEEFHQCIHWNKDGKAALNDGTKFQNNTDIMVAAVVYDPVAAEGIRDQKLYSARQLDQRLETKPLKPVSMPQNSIVLKAMLWPVPYDRYVPLPLWDCPDPNADEIKVKEGDKTAKCEVYAGFEHGELWPRAAVLTADPDAPVGPRTGPVTYLEGVKLQDTFDLDCKPRRVRTSGITYVGYDVVSLDRFYSIRFSSKTDFENLDACDRALLHQSALWSYGRKFDHRDVLVLVAMHVMTKEQPDWTFQSTWWSYKDPTGRCSDFADDRPAPVEGDPLSNYLLTTTYGMTQKAGQHRVWPKILPLGVQRKDYWPLAYNPYIELAAGHPIETNCINCHHRAAWPSRLMRKGHPHDRRSAYLVSEDGAPGLLKSFKDTSRIFDGLLLMDSMWSVSDRANYSASEASPAEPPE